MSKGPRSSVQALPAPKVNSPSKPKNPSNVSMDISSKFEEEEEDLVSFNNEMDACDCAADALDHSRLS